MKTIWACVVAMFLIVFCLVLAGKPAAPANDQSPKSLVIVVGHDVTLSWDLQANMTFNVYDSNQSGGPYTKIGTTSVPQYTDLGPTAGHTYFYVITAVDSQNRESGFSTEVSATIPTP